MSRSKDLLRTTFREHEYLIDDGRDLLPGVKRRIAGRRRAKLAAVSAGTALAVAVIAVTGGILLRGGRPALPTPEEASGVSAAAPAPAGWRLESALGAQFAVPASWGINDTGCGQSSKPSVVRAQGAVSAVGCLNPEPPTKSIADLSKVTPPEQRSAPSPLPSHPVTIDGVPAQRGEGRLQDGRYTGSITIPSRSILLTVRTPQPAIGRRILDSLHLVTIDFNGCSVKRPAGRPGHTDSATLAPSDPAAISVCSYSDRSTFAHDDALQTSGQLTGDAARTLAAALNSAKPGGIPDNPHGCAAVRPVPDVVLLIRDRAGRPSTVFATFEGCIGRGLDNGTRRTVITQGLVQRLAAVVHSNFSWDGDLPH